jgi:hypothetical protein
MAILAHSLLKRGGTAQSPAAISVMIPSGPTRVGKKFCWLSHYLPYFVLASLYVLLPSPHQHHRLWPPLTCSLVLASSHDTRCAVGDPVVRCPCAVFYSTYGHIYKLAQAIAEGAGSVAGVTVRLTRVQETLSDEILEKMHALEAQVLPLLGLSVSLDTTR